MPPRTRLLIAVALLLLVVSCDSLSKQERIHKDLTGHWLVLYADHKLTSDAQRRLYGGVVQDSIISLRGLKLVTFMKDGSFQQVDAPGKTGKWAVNNDNDIYIMDGGRGFDNFKTEFFDYDNKLLRSIEYLPINNERIKLVWHLKKIDSSFLFEPANNEWRKKATKPETDAEIKARLSAILDYYTKYYRLVSKESSYFIPERVVLPYTFYQHGMGMKSFYEESPFAALFYDSTEAKTAYDLLTKAMNSADDFPSGSNFVEEYSLFMGMMAEEVKKVN
jgi:hypothetical protein